MSEMASYSIQTCNISVNYWLVKCLEPHASLIDCLEFSKAANEGFLYAFHSKTQDIQMQTKQVNLPEFIQVHHYYANMALAAM